MVFSWVCPSVDFKKLLIALMFEGATSLNCSVLYKVVICLNCNYNLYFLNNVCLYFCFYLNNIGVKLSFSIQNITSSPSFQTVSQSSPAGTFANGKSVCALPTNRAASGMPASAIGTLAKGIMALAVLAIAATVAIVGAGVFAAFGLAAAFNVSPVVTGLSLATGALPVVGLCYYLIKNKL